VARPAIVIRSDQEIPAGPKSVVLELGSSTSGGSPPALVVQTFDAFDTLEHADVVVT
jgi:hypothetical protein